MVGRQAGVIAKVNGRTIELNIYEENQTNMYYVIYQTRSTKFENI